jgi:transposase
LLGVASGSRNATPQEPKKKRSRYDQRPGTVQRGMKLRLYPAPVDSRWIVSDGGTSYVASIEAIKAQPTLAGKPIRGATVEAVRAALPAGLVCLGRNPSDAPAIVESWIVDTQAEWGRQNRVFGLWSARARALWNLLLELQMAAYSGEKRLKEVFNWRAIWADVARENYRLACERYEEAYPGSLANPPPPPDPMPILMERIAKSTELGHASEEDAEEIALLLMGALDSATRKEAETALAARLAQMPLLAPAVATPGGARAFVKQLRQMAKAAVKQARESAPKQPPTPPDIDKIMGRGTVDSDGSSYAPPRLFIWENDLQKLMALLKQIPYTRWIGDLPSHACQHVVKDLVKALQGVSSGKGFPQFKKARPDGESVYLANTQLKWDIASSRVKLPGSVGWIGFEGGLAPRRLRLLAAQSVTAQEGDATLARTGEDKFLGARLWCRAGRWYLSPQFELLAKPAPRFTGRHIAVKFGAGTQATVYDGVAIKEFPTPAEPRHRHGDLLRRRRSRSVLDTGTKKRKATLRASRRREARGLDPLPRPARLRRSRELRDVNAAISGTEAHDADKRNDRQHKLSRRIVRMGDSLTLETLDVAGMMQKEQDPVKRAEQMRRRRKTREGVAAEGEIVHKAPPKVLRKALRGAAPSRLRAYLKYKAEEAARPVNEQHPLDPRVVKCGARIKDGARKGEICGHLNYIMRDGRQLHQCSGCRALMRRNVNAVENVYESGKANRESGLEAAE